MQKSDLALEKYWVKHSGYFRTETTVTLSMEIKDTKLRLCSVILFQIRDKIFYDRVQLEGVLLIIQQTIYS